MVCSKSSGTPGFLRHGETSHCYTSSAKHRRLPSINFCLALAAIFLLLLLQVVPARGDMPRICDAYNNRPHPNGLCGRRLPIVLAGLCRRFTVLMRQSLARQKPQKRSADVFPTQFATGEPEVTFDMQDFHQLIGPEVSPTEVLPEGIILERKSALSYLSKRQPESDILCECCYNHCSVMELLQYCDIPTL